MAKELKIEDSYPNLLVKYRTVVKYAMEKGLRKALLSTRRLVIPLHSREMAN